MTAGQNPVPFRFLLFLTRSCIHHLLLLVVRIQNLRVWDGVQWHNVPKNFVIIGQMIKKLKVSRKHAVQAV